MRIGEVAELTGLNISNIRFYERKGLIDPGRQKESQYRDYTKEDVERLKLIILYRKMDFSIEKIASLVGGQCSADELIGQQILELNEKQKAIQGAIDLCRKFAEDETDGKKDIDYYLNYVKEEEAQGRRFGDVEEFLNDFSKFTQFDRLIADPYLGWILLRFPWAQKLIRRLWLGLWIGLPVFGIILFAVDADGINVGGILFWIGWMIFAGISFLRFRKVQTMV